MVSTLALAGVERVYEVAGDSLNGITDSIRKSGGIRWISVRHEETAAFAAGAAAHLTGHSAVWAGSCGPGNLHLINGLYDAHRSRVPVLAIAAHIPSREIGSGYFQETHPEQLFRECSHYCELVSNREQMPRILEIAMQTANSRRGVAVVVHKHERRNPLARSASQGMSLDKSIALFGATGLVGGECLRVLQDDGGFSRVMIFTRRPLAVKPEGAADRPKLETHVLDFEQMERLGEALAVDQIVCALGTTIRKAGSRQEFRKVDFDYPLAIARLALAQGARHFLLVSALGANAGSRLFYNRVKGELEAAILALPFRSHTIVRPSLLLGKRAEFRLGEKIAEWLAFLMPEKYKPVSAAAVAEALVAAAREDRAGKRIIESAEIRASAGRRRDPGPVS